MFKSVLAIGLCASAATMNAGTLELFTNGGFETGDCRGSVECVLGNIAVGCIGIHNFLDRRTATAIPQRPRRVRSVDINLDSFIG